VTDRFRPILRTLTALTLVRLTSAPTGFEVDVTGEVTTS
jgi:hypothetical protein